MISRVSYSCCKTHKIFTFLFVVISFSNANCYNTGYSTVGSSVFMVVDKVYLTPLLLIHWPMDKVVSVRLVWKQQCHDRIDSFHDIDNYSQTSDIIACRRCSNYIFIPDLTSGFNVLCKNNCKTRRENLCFGIWSHYIRDLTVNGRRRSQSWFIMALMCDIYCNTWCYRQNYGMGIFLNGRHVCIWLVCNIYVLRGEYFITGQQDIIDISITPLLDFRSLIDKAG